MAKEGSPTDTGLYTALEKHLKHSDHPLTCVDLFDHTDVKKAGGTVNVVSDALGHLWRRGFLRREPAPRTVNSQAKWAYTWAGVTKIAKVPHTRSNHVHVADLPEPETPHTIMARQAIEIRESTGAYEIVLPDVTITIKRK